MDRPKVIKKCLNCNKEFEVLWSQRNRKKYCSKDCARHDMTDRYFRETQNEVIGKKFGLLTILDIFKDKHNNTCRPVIMAKCKCDCGKETTSRLYNIRENSTRSCGCLNIKIKYEDRDYAARIQVFNQYKNNAKTRGLNFELDYEYFSTLISGECFYCGEKHSNETSVSADGEVYTLKHNGVDRINSSIGYIEGNVVSCCSMCNRMKLDYNVDTWINKVIKIAEHIKEPR